MEKVCLHVPAVGVRVVDAQVYRVVRRIVCLYQIIKEHNDIVFALHEAQHLLSHRQPPPKRWVAGTALLLFERAMIFFRVTAVLFKILIQLNLTIKIKKHTTYIKYYVDSTKNLCGSFQFC